MSAGSAIAAGADRQRRFHPTTDRLVEIGSAADWRATFGDWWWADLLVAGLAAFVLGAMVPLLDPDLPQHLANGEWIVRNRSWPTVEPFAWTRAGEPYFAYSHLPQVLYYSVLSWFGPLGLRALNGLVLCAAGAAMLVLGRFAGWRPWVSLTLAAYNVLMGMLVAPALRPQSILLVAVPLCWGFAYAVLRCRQPAGPMIGLMLASALAANSHLFFPITAAPLVLCFIARPRQSWRIAAVAVPILAGWLLSPYGLRWHDVFALNFGANALLEMPSPISEFRPGFSAPDLLTLLLAPLMLLPWAVPSTVARRERVLYAAIWLAGLILFGYAIRLVLIWWLILLPMAALAVGRLTSGLSVAPPRRRIRVAAYALMIALCALPFAAGAAQADREGEGDVRTRRLPSAAQEPTDPLVEWLACHVGTGATGRVFTWFNYGSYLTWRMPGYPMSIDGRTIFPDSVAQAEVLISAKRQPVTLGPWASADLAIVPVNFRVAAVLDTATDWRRAAVNPATAERHAVALWVRESWWMQATGRPLPQEPVSVTPLGLRPAGSVNECRSD